MKTFTKKIRARKKHLCDICGGIVGKNENYIKLKRQEKHKSGRLFHHDDKNIHVACYQEYVDIWGHQAPTVAYDRIINRQQPQHKENIKIITKPSEPSEPSDTWPYGYHIQTNIKCCAHCGFGGFIGEPLSSDSLCICELNGRDTGDYNAIAKHPLGKCHAFKWPHEVPNDQT